jgi:hypothetical protein
VAKEKGKRFCLPELAGKNKTIAKELPATSPQTVPSRSSEAQFKTASKKIGGRKSVYQG